MPAPSAFLVAALGNGGGSNSTGNQVTTASQVMTARSVVAT